MDGDNEYTWGRQTLTREQWAARLVWCVARSANGHPEPLQVLAQRLVDADLAREALVSRGYGSEDKPLTALVALALASKGEGPDVPV